MTPLLCLHTESACYRAAQAAHPVGIVLHSTGVNNPSLKRYVQPSADDPRREELLQLLGKNRNGNSWNRGVKKSAHYLIGRLQDGTPATVQILPEEISAWGVGKGKKGSYNYDPVAHLQIEICEDGGKDAAYCLSSYGEAVALCADICQRKGWGAEVIVSHKEAHKAGYGSSHKDPEHWFKRHGLSMTTFREDVAALLTPVALPVVGDTVRFSGTVQYTSSGKRTGKPATPCIAVVKQIYRLNKARHPYLIKGPGVYGWVDGKDLTPV